MNSLEYYGYAKLDCLAFWYVAEHFNAGDGYTVFDWDGLPLFGFIPNSIKPIHEIEVKKCKAA